MGANVGSIERQAGESQLVSAGDHGVGSGEADAAARRRASSQRNSGIVEGRPTRMKNRAKACEKCSRKGGFNRQRGPICFAWSARYSWGRLKISRKSTTRA